MMTKNRSGIPAANSILAPRNVVTAFGPRKPASVRPSLIDSWPSALGRKPARRASMRSQAGRRCVRRVCHQAAPSVEVLISARRAATGSDPAWRWEMTPKMSRATVAKTRTTARITRSMAASHLDRDHATDPEEAHDLQHDTDHEQLLAGRITEEGQHVIGRQQRDDGSQGNRQDGKDHAGQAAVCRARADVAENAEALADDARDRFHDLGQVAARLALDDHGGDEEPEIERVDALGQVDQRLLHVDPQVLLVERDGELLGQRL